MSRLYEFVHDLSTLLGTKPDETRILAEGGALLERLIAKDDWLPEELARPDPERYQQYLLHCDSAETFSIVSFVWGPGQTTPVHNHTVWGLIGVLRGAEYDQRYREQDGRFVPAGPEERLEAGQVASVSPNTQDIHRVRNAYEDRASISIHVYGANIGAVERAVFPPDGGAKRFISGYSNRFLPNIWDRSARPVAGF